MKFLLLMSIIPLSLVYADAQHSATIKELSSHLYYIKTLYKKSRESYESIGRLDETKHTKQLMNPYGHFHHGEIQTILHEVENQKNIIPLITLWQKFIQNPQSIKDHELFLHEVGMLIFLVYNALLNRVENARAVACVKKPQTLYEAIHLFRKIYGLPLTQLVLVLNDIRQEVIVVMQEYPLKENQSYMGWLREYWWLPPTIIAGIIASIILRD